MNQDKRFLNAYIDQIHHLCQEYSKPVLTRTVNTHVKRFNSHKKRMMGNNSLLGRESGCVVVLHVPGSRRREDKFAHENPRCGQFVGVLSSTDNK